MNKIGSKDVIVIWKLDRPKRSLKHLVELVAELNERDIGLRSLNDPIDTTTAQGRLVFNIFASLAEFEREIIRFLSRIKLIADSLIFQGFTLPIIPFFGTVFV